MKGESSSIPAVVVDTGSALIKAGITGRMEPQTIFSNIIGYPTKVNAFADLEDTNIEYYVGDDALERPSIKNYSYPMQKKRIISLDSMQRVWYYMFFQKLQINPNEISVIYAEPLITNEKDRELILESFFDIFWVPSLSLVSQSLLALYSVGNITGIVIDIGEEITTLTPFYEGFMLTPLTRVLEFGGNHVTKYLHLLLKQNGYNLTSKKELSILKEIKEYHCFVDTKLNSTNKDRSFLETIKIKKILPDGQFMRVDEELFEAPELLFYPEKAHIPIEPLAENILQVVKNCDISIRKELLSNIVLSGASTTFNGFPERLKQELVQLTNSKNIGIIATDYRHLATWKGGSLYYFMPSFTEKLMKKRDYLREGTSILERIDEEDKNPLL